MDKESILRFLKGDEKFYNGIMVDSTYSCVCKMKGNKRKQEIEYLKCVGYDQVFKGGELVDGAKLLNSLANLKLDGESACGIPSNKVFYTTIEIEREKNSVVAVSERVKELFGENAFEKFKIKWKEIPYERIEGKKDIAVFLMKNEDFDSLKKLYVELLGIDVAVLEPEFVAIGRVISACYPEKERYAVIHVEEDRSGFYVYIGENPYVVKTYPYGLNRIVERIASEYGITKEKAKKILKGEEEATRDELMVVGGFLTFVTGDINGVVDETTKPDWLFLVGKGVEGTKIYDVAKESRIWEGTAEGISVVNPVLAFSKEEINIGRPSQTTAIGLAMRYEGDEEE